MKNCSNCKKVLNISDKFCDSCGAENEINYIYSTNWKKKGLLGSRGKVHDILIDDEGLKLIEFPSPWRGVTFFLGGMVAASMIGLENLSFFIGLFLGILGQIMDNNIPTQKRKKWLSLDGRILNASYKVVNIIPKEKILSDVDIEEKRISIFSNDGGKMSFVNLKTKAELLNNYIEKHVL